MYFGRASTRPYSYAMCAIAVIYSLLRDGCPYGYAMCAIAVIYSLLRDGCPYGYAMYVITVIYNLLSNGCPCSYAMCVIVVIYSLLCDDCQYKQCRGEWKLARVPSAVSVLRGVRSSGAWRGVSR